VIVIDDVDVIGSVIVAVHLNVNDTLIVIATLIGSDREIDPIVAIIGPAIPLRLDSRR
jgi:hypothetical protein